MRTAMGLLLAIAASAVQADNLNTNVNLGGNATEQSAAFGVTHIELGSFVDSFTFTPSSGNFLVDASLVTLGFTPVADINFDYAILNGNYMTLTGPVPEAEAPRMLARLAKHTGLRPQDL